MTNIKHAREQLDNALQSAMLELGFEKQSELEYAWDAYEGEGRLLLSFPCRLDKRGFVAFTCTAGLRFDAIIEWVETAGSQAVIAMPVHLLRPEGRFWEWQFRTAAELIDACSGVLSDVRHYVIPWAEKFSRLDAIEQALQSARPVDWFNLDADRRVVVRAALMLSRGQRALAINSLRDALADRSEALPKHRLEIEKLLKRVNQSEVP